MSTTDDQPRRTDGRFAGYAAPRADIDLTEAGTQRIDPLRQATPRLDPDADFGGDLP